ncbi:MAG TPA: VOC family protein [Steroidobacteraceae bacterium]|nr:VOC family protein [Steroidobacteraceae bacterium]
MSSSRLLCAALAAALCSTLHAGDFALGAGRVGAKDPAALAPFYESVFGMKEVNRLQMGQSMEVMLNFGATLEAAKANTGAQVIIMHRDVDNDADPVPHLIFFVPDVKAAATAVVAASGKITTQPVAAGSSGAWIAMGEDPAGNRFEMVQRAAGR